MRPWSLHRWEISKFIFIVSWKLLIYRVVIFNPKVLLSLLPLLRIELIQMKLNLKNTSRKSVKNKLWATEVSFCWTKDVLSFCLSGFHSRPSHSFHYKEKEDTCIRKIERVIKFDVSVSTQGSYGVRNDDWIQLNNWDDVIMTHGIVM